MEFGYTLLHVIHFSIEDYYGKFESLNGQNSKFS